MKTLGSALAIVFVVAASSFGQTTGWNIVSTSGAAPPNTTTSATTIDVKPFYSTDICSAINAAIISVPVGPVTIDARGIPASPGPVCNTQPFASGGMGYTGKLLLGGYAITTTVQWEMPNQYFYIEGTALGNSSSQGTMIRASGSSWGSCALPYKMNAGCPVIFIGSPTVTSLGTGVRNLVIDCNNLQGCIGVGSTQVQEGGGVDGVSFINQTTECIDFSSEKGGVGISNPFIRNVDCNFGTSNLAASPIGIYINATDGPAEISNTTVAVTGVVNQLQYLTDCLDLDGGRGTNINYFHCEHATNAEVLGDSVGSAHDVTVNGLTASATLVGVLIKNTADYDINVESVGLASVPGATPYAVVDDVNIAHTVGLTVAKYMIGASSVATGGASFTTDNGGSTVLSTATVTTLQPYRVGFISTTLSVLNSAGSGLAGQVAWCSDCQPASGASVCSGSGTGALAVKQLTGSGNWYCK